MYYYQSTREVFVPVGFSIFEESKAGTHIETPTTSCACAKGRKHGRKRETHVLH